MLRERALKIVLVLVGSLFSATDALVPLIGVATLDLAQRDGDKQSTDQRAPIRAV